MEGWGKIGVQSASVLYPNSCYNELCYIEVQVYKAKSQNHEIQVTVTQFYFEVKHQVILTHYSKVLCLYINKS